MKWMPIKTAPKNGTKIIVARFTKTGLRYAYSSRWWKYALDWEDINNVMPFTGESKNTSLTHWAKQPR